MIALSQVFRRIRGVLNRIPDESKEQFRQFYFRSDIAQTKIIILLLATVIALYAVSDYMIFGFSLVFYALIILRAGLIYYTAFQFNYLRRVKNYRSYDKSMLLYLLALVLGILLVNLTRPQNFLSHVIIVDIAVFVFYLVIPTRFSYQAIPSIAFTVGEMLIIFFAFETYDAPALLTAVISMIFANIVASLSSLQLHSYRWRIFQDIGKRKEAERLAVIGQTAGMVGHDIRNPLQAITGDLYLLKDELKDMPENVSRKAALENIDDINENISYINKVISDLQDYTRTLKPQTTKVYLCSAIPEIVSKITIPKAIHVSIQCDTQMPHLLLDPTLLKRIITNLVTNAVQAMPDGGNLTIRTFIKSNKAIISVEDTGVGIPEKVKPKIFTPMFTTKSKGQGFGLPVVKRLVEAQGGTITFESEVGKGTTFTIELPLV